MAKSYDNCKAFLDKHRKINSKLAVTQRCPTTSLSTSPGLAAQGRAELGQALTTSNYRDICSAYAQAVADGVNLRTGLRAPQDLPRNLGKSRTPHVQSTSDLKASSVSKEE
jgi:hypothetical protein